MNTQGMSPEEAALTEELDSDGMPAEMASESANRQELQRPSDEDGDDDSESPATAEAVAAPAPAPAPVEPKPIAARSDDDDAPETAPYTVDVPADASEQLATLKTEHDNAFRELMDGNMAETAYREIADRTQAAQKAIESKMLTANVLSEMSQQQAANEWKRAQAAEFTSFKTAGLDYQGKPALLAAYNVNLKSLATVPENEAKSAKWFLREADRLTRADLGLTATPAASPAPAPAARGVDRTQIPPTLSRVPPAVDPTVAGDEFAHIASLTGAAAERAYAQMTPEQQERYLDA